MSNDINDPLAKIPKHIRDTIPEDMKQKMKENQALISAIYELSDLYGLLKQDISDPKKFESRNDSAQVWRRSTYRAVFSWIEGTVYQMKQVALNTQGGYYRAQFSPAEISFLQEESYFLDDKGNAKIKGNNFSPIAKNLKFIYAKLTQGFNLSTTLEIDKQGWDQFKKAINIRNRLVHPKKAIDLHVNDEEMKFLLGTINWFDEQVSKVITDIRATIEPILEKIREEGAADIQNKTENAMMLFDRVGKKVGKVEDAIAIIDELESENIDPKIRNEKIETAKTMLTELKQEIISELKNNES